MKDELCLEDCFVQCVSDRMQKGIKICFIPLPFDSACFKRGLIP